jgi:hypothetical protein
MPARSSWLGSKPTPASSLRYVKGKIAAAMTNREIEAALSGTAGARIGQINEDTPK